MKSKRLFITVCSLLCFAVFITLGNGLAAEKAKKLELKFAQVVYPAPCAHMDAVERIAKKVTEQTKGRITFKLFGPELADYVELNEMVMRGTIDMELNVQAPTYDKRWNAMDLPYLVSTYTEAKKHYGPGGFMDQILGSWASATNKVWLGTWIQGFRGVSLKSRAATTPEEAKGLKIRVPPAVIFDHYWRALGFSPVLIPYSEVPTAISTGVVDGQAGGGPFQAYTLVRDINKYYIWYHDSLEAWGFAINADTWKKLDSADQQIIKAAVDEEVLLRVKGAEEEDRTYLKKLEDHGWTCIDLENYPEKMKRSKELCREVWKVMDDVVGKDVINEIRTKVKEAGL